MCYRISRSMTKGVLEYAAHKGIPAEKILEGTGLTPDFFDEINKSYSVEIDGIINKNTKRLFNDENIGFKIGRELYAIGVIPPILIITAKLLGNPRLVYKEVVKEGKKFNNYIEYEYVKIEANEAHIITKLKAGYLAQSTDCGYEAGIYSAVPTLWGLPFAEVKQPRCIKKGDEVCEYHIKWIGNLQPFKQLGVFFSGRIGAINTLNQQYNELQDAYHNLEKSYHELESLKEELSAKVTSQNKELYELNMQLSQFFTSMAHELKTPLSLIKAPIEGIMKGDFGNSIDNNHGTFRLIDNQANRITYIVNNILTQTKIETGKLTLDKKIIDARNFLDEVVIDAAMLVKKHSLRWRHTNKVSKDLNIVIDPALLYLAFMNLISNAIKYNRESGEVHFSAWNTEGFIKLSIRDTGIGMPNGTESKIFKYGYQLSCTSGMGIGLSLVKSICELHQIGIKVNSALNKGTTFTLFIPIESGTIVAEELSNNWKSFTEWPLCTENSSMDSKYNPDIPSILIIEDNHEILEYLHSYFSVEYNVKTASNCEAAADILSSHKVNLIISDYMLPGQNGLDFYRSIRKNEGLRIIPFIIITAKSDDHLKRTALEEGVIEYIEKPFSLTFLKAKVKNLIEFQALLEKSSEIDIEELKHEHFNNIFNEYKITKQEQNIINLTLKGFDRNEIAHYLSISPNTVKRHMENIFQKMSVHSKQELIAFIML